MKIKGTCKRCHREFLSEQAIANGGVCPWDGEPFSADYAVTLVDAMREVAEYGSRSSTRSSRSRTCIPAFVLDEDSVIANTRTQFARLARISSRRAERGRPPWGSTRCSPGGSSGATCCSWWPRIVVVGVLLAWAFFGT